MPLIPQEKKEQYRGAVRHPVKFMKGEDLPPEQIRPWEMATQIVPRLFGGLRDGFTWNAMTMFQNVFGVNKRLQTAATVSTVLFDGLNDPIIGAFMDTKNIPIRVHRWIMRFSTVFNGILTLMIMVNWNVTPWQRIGLYIAVRCIQDMVGTPAQVSNAKVWAHITPYTEQRAKMNWAAGLGETIWQMVYPVYFALIGLRDVMGWSEYSIYFLGALIFSIPAMFLDLTPSFVLQRVPDKINPPSEFTGLKGFFLEMKEAFGIVRHNKYFILNMAASFVTALTPGIGDNDFYRFCGVDDLINTGGRRIRSELLLWLRDNIIYLPSNFTVPFSLQIIKKAGGARNMRVLYESIAVGTNFLKWLVGMKSVGAVLCNWGLEMLRGTLHKVDGVAGGIINYEMLDYVEWKTGRRSEGVNMAVDGLVKKMLINNIDKTIGNLTIDALGFDPAKEKQPALFLKWAPVLYLLVPVIDSGIWLIAKLLYKYPGDREQVETDLIERRRLAQEMKEGMEEEALMGE